MSADPLIVPTIVPSGSLHFATIAADGTIQDVIDILVADTEVTAEVLGDLDPYGWAMQRIRREPNGRQWEEDELEALGNGILAPSTAVAPLLNAPSPSAHSQRHFSAFPLTSHLHTPTLRLVSLHPFLSVTFSFLRVPEIHDGFQWKLFISRTSTVGSAVEAVIEELGLTKALPVPGGGSLEYVLEEVWSSDHSEKATRLPFANTMSEILENSLSTNPYGASASRSFRFCVPDEWYRRSKSRSTSSTSTVVSEDTIRRLADLQEDDEEEGEGEESTAKLKSPGLQEQQLGSSQISRGGFVAPIDWRGSISQNRFSSIIDSWMRPQSPVGHEEKPTPKIVSEPKLVEHKAGEVSAGNSAEESAVDDVDPADFEQMLDDLGLKGPKREAMYGLPPEQKRYLLQQNQVSRASTLSRSSGAKVNKPPATPSTYGPASAAAMLPRLMPQLTGDSGIMKRFSIAGWSAGTSSPSSGPPDSPRSSVDLGSKRRDSMVSVKSLTEKAAETPALQPQSTGGLWSSWWMSSGGDKGPGGDKTKEAEKTAAWYAAGIRNGRATDTKLVKHLISLRVHLSTANLAWIEEFVTTESGMNTLSDLLARLVSKGGKRRKLTEIEDTVLLETIKCLRALLNTEPGFREVLTHPTIITHLAYSLHGSSAKLRTLTSEVLAAICVLSLKEGHKAVLSAMSDYRVEFEEAFRFQELIASMRLPEIIDEEETASDAGYDNGEEGAWEARTASMALINALTNCPESLEERVLLREEFSRRGLNEVIVTLRYVKPPESLVTQLDVYTEEKFEDEEDMRERARDVVDDRRSPSETEPVVDDLLRVAKQHEDLYATLLAILKRFFDLFERDVDRESKAELFTILQKFVEHAVFLDDLDDKWCSFLKRFSDSVQYITGQVVDVRLASDSNHSLLQDEIEQLRATVDKLTDERVELRKQLEQQAAELSTLKSIPPIPASISRGAGRGNPESTQNFHGVVQRLVQKEKQVLQLQADLDRLKAQNPAEPREADERTKRERDRVKWHALNEEIANLKSQTGELETAIGIKDKEIVYLKRALESVYSRFRSREESKESETRDAEFDAQDMASRAIDSLTRKDEEIAILRAEIDELKAKLAAKPKFITEKDYKHQVPPPPPPPVKPLRATTLPPAAISGLPNGRTAIMLSRVKLGLSDIRRALLELDDMKLSVDELRAISRQLPTSEEVTRLKDFGDLSKLAKADQYFGQIMTIPRLSQRLECMLYRRKLELEVEEIRPDLDVVHLASRELRSSARFKRVLQAILAVGNALNGSTFRGGAKGFQLEALLKLRETKTVKATPDCPTLLHYLAKVLLRSDPSLVTFIEDMPHVEAAARVSVQTVAQSVQALVIGLKQVNEEIDQLRRMPTISQDRFVVTMQPFVLQMSPIVESLKNMATSLESELRSLLLFYGENPDSPEAPKPEDFFGLILSFSSSLQKAALEVHDAMPKTEPPPPKINVEDSSSAGESTIKGTDKATHGDTLRPSYGRAAGRSVGRGELDQAIRSMRTGRRRDRAAPSRPLSKIFVDGARTSRIFE
ncbi:hypothetical protein BN946_scf185015.g111 [Trametes cinnabarina]|uniref:FH2 domain-containing protein n=1 Tax=Pycnoporus cinnabarinus TaxID=5643 RepID=A0A060SN08_PYCCI|nr:hypothetical protein BN946_scf185015.g111 [Trametes cinnabarina]